jgi:hypothetical protein
VSSREPHPARWEFSAVPVALATFGVAAAIFAGVWLGIWAALLVTVGFALVALVALVRWASSRPRLPDTDAPRVRPVNDGRHRVLLIADASCVSQKFVAQLRARGGEEPVTVFVVAPALESRLGFLTDDQGGFDDAKQHLGATVDLLREGGLEAEGEIGANDPIQSADDGLRQFPADEIVFVTSPEDRGGWLEEGLVARAQQRYVQPVAHIVVEAG